MEEVNKDAVWHVIQRATFAALILKSLREGM